MRHVFVFAILFLSSISTALAQAKAAQPGQFTAPSPGSYSGSLKDANGARTSDVKLEIRDVTKDGRVTARLSATNTSPECAKPRPASGIMLNDNSMRLEVEAGAPEGCARTYTVKAESGALSGTFVDARSAQKSKK
jgi:hypothetical protein